MTQDYNKEILKEWNLSKFGGSLLMHAPDGIPSVLDSNDELISDKVADWFLSHHKEHIQKVVEKLKKSEKVCAYCLDTHYMRVNGKLQRGCVWCDNGKKKEGLEPDQLTSLDTIVSYNQALSDLLTSLGITE